MAVSKEDILKSVSEMSVKDVVELVKLMEDEFGVSAAAPVAVAAPGAAGGEAGSAEKSEFDVILKSFGGNKVSVIKVVRNLTGLGLKEAKDLVEGAPSDIKKGVSKEDAEKIKKELEEAGAEVELK